MSAEAQADFDDALSRAFAVIEAAKKDKKNPHFKSSYADLASVTEAVKGPLTAEGFSWPQTISMEDGMVVVTTHLRRKGVELSSVLPMPIGNKATPQAVGSAITYARRYALSALVGVAPDDDDGNAASEGGGGEVRRPGRQQQRKPAPRQEQKPGGWRANVEPHVQQADKVCRELVRERIGLIRELGISREAMEQSTTALLAEILDIEPSKGGYDEMAPRFTLDQWGDINARLRKDVNDLLAMKKTAGEFDGAVEGAAE